MRIAHVTATYPPLYTGTGVVCAQNAASLAARGHQVTVFTAADAAGPSEPGAGLAVRRLPVRFRIGNAPLLAGLGELRRYDLVHLHYPFYFGGETVYLQSLLHGVPYVLTYHQDVLFPGLLRYAESVHRRLAGAAILRRARRVLVTSWDYARASRVGQMLGGQWSRVEELPNSVDAQRFHPSLRGDALRAGYGLAGDERVVLFVGALDRPHFFKGVPVLLEAVARMAGRGLRLLVVGDGELRCAYAAIAARLGIGDRVVFCGRVPGEALPLHYALADVAVLPSTTMGEAFGVVLIEAMACGKPVIATDLPGVRSVVEDGVNGLLARPGQADDLAAKLAAILGDPERAVAMGQAGRRRVEERYDAGQQGERLEAIYGDVLAATRSWRNASVLGQGR